MSNVEIQLNEASLRDAMKTAERFVDSYEEKVDREIEQGAETIQQKSKDKAPVQSGNLKDKIEVYHKDGHSIVRWEAGYSAFPEFGTPRQPAQRFARDAIKEGVSEIIANIRKL